MDYLIFEAKCFVPKEWSGGTTTELFIFPETAEYRLRDFRFRLSTAKIETEVSDFTMLRGISRKLMVLSGSTVLHHAGHHSSNLSKFEVATFQGDWKTTSVGMCTDFNLMTTGNTTGMLSAHVIKQNQVDRHRIKACHDWVFLYLYSGETEIHIHEKKYTIHQGDLLVLKQPEEKIITFRGIENSELVVCEIENAYT